MQMMLLEQQNKRRHLMYRQWEEDKRAQMHQEKMRHGSNQLQHHQMQLMLLGEKRNKEHLRMHREQCNKINRGARRNSKFSVARFWSRKLLCRLQLSFGCVEHME